MFKYEDYDVFVIEDIHQLLLVRPESYKLFLSDLSEHYIVLQEFLLHTKILDECTKHYDTIIPRLDVIMWVDDPHRNSSDRILLPVNVERDDDGVVMDYDVITVTELIIQSNTAKATIDKLIKSDDSLDSIMEIMELAGIDLDNGLVKDAINNIIEVKQIQKDIDFNP